MTVYKIRAGVFNSYSETTKFKKKHQRFSNAPVVSFNNGYAIELFSSFNLPAAEKQFLLLSKEIGSVIIKSWD